MNKIIRIFSLLILLFGINIIVKAQTPVLNTYPSLVCAGEKIVVQGQFFTPVTGIDFGGANAVFTIIDDTSIEITVPSTYSSGDFTLYSPNGQVSSSNVSLQPSGSILNDIQSQQLCVGNDAMFSSTVSNAASMRWQIKEANSSRWVRLTAGGVYENIDTNTLTIKNITKAMDGDRFRLRVTDNCNRNLRSLEATLNVSDAPKIDNSSSPAGSVCSDSDIDILVSDTSPDTKFDWTISTLPSGLTVDNSSGTSGTIKIRVINNTTETKVLVVTVTPKNDNCTGTPAQYTVTVAANINVTDSPSNQSVCEGTSASFTADGTGYNITRQWQVQDVGSTTWSNLSDNTVYAGTSTNNLLVNNTTFSLNNKKYRLRIVDDCGKEEVSSVATLQVTKSPKVEFSGNQKICDQDSFSLSFSDPNNTVGTSFDWSIIAPAGLSIPTLSGVSNISNLTVTNSTKNVQRFEVRVVPKNNTCVGTSASYFIDVSPKLSSPQHSGDVKLCNSVPLDISFSDPDGNTGVTFEWEVTQQVNVTGASNGSGLKITDAVVNNSGVEGLLKYTVKSVINGCSGEAKEIEIIVNSATNIVKQPVDLSICSDDTGVFEANVNGNSLTYQWQSQASGTSNWNDLSDNSIFSGVDTEILNLLKSDASMDKTSFRLKIIDNCGNESFTDVVSLAVNPTPTVAPSLSVLNVCSNDAIDVSFTDNENAGTVFNWTSTLPADVTLSSEKGTGNISGITATNTSNLVKIITFEVTPTLNGCVGVSKTFSVQVNPIPETPVITGVFTTCSDENLDLTISDPNNTSTVIFNWTTKNSINLNPVTDGSGVRITDKLVVNDLAREGSITYVVVPVINGCEGQSKEFRVTVKPKPILSVSPTNYTICTGEMTNIELKDDSSNATTFSWVTNGQTNGATNGNGSQIAQLLTNNTDTPVTVDYTIIPTRGACPGTPVLVRVTVNPIPILSVTNNAAELCSGQSTDISFTETLGLSNITFRYVASSSSSDVTGFSNGQGVSINQTLVNNGSAVQTVTYDVMANASTNCFSANQSIAIKVYPNQTFNLVGDKEVCGQSDLVLDVTKSNDINSFTWSIDGSSDGLVYDGSANTLTFSPKASQVGTTVMITGTTNNPSNPCNSVSKTFSIVVTSLPSISLTGLKDFYGINQPDVALIGAPSGGVYSGPGVANGTHIFNASVAGEGIHDITYTYTDPNTGCQNTVTSVVQIFPLPVVNIINLDGNEYCSSDFNIQLNATPTVEPGKTSGVWSGDGVSDNKFEPSLVGVGEHDISYTYTDERGISNTAIAKVKVKASPKPNFSFINKCNGEEVKFTDLTLISGNDVVVKWEWDFGSGQTSLEQNPSIFFPAPGTYVVRLKVTTNGGCSSTFANSIIIGDFPTVDFAWKDHCFTQDMIFEDKSTTNLGSAIASHRWEFDDPSTGSLNFSTEENPTHRFSKPGTYNVILTVTTSGVGCNLSLSKKVTVFEKHIVTDSFFDGFEINNNNWVAGGTDSSWTNDIPTSNLNINSAASGTKVWAVNLKGQKDNVLNNNGENSWITSPCFDISSLKAPKLSFDYFSYTQSKKSGAAIEVSEDAGRNWRILGSDSQSNSLGWYNENSIIGSPGSSDNPLGVGWSGEFANWSTATYNLQSEFKDLTILKNLQFRVAFGAPQNNSIGGTQGSFAIDNFEILSRSKAILLENFTNYNSAAYAKVENDIQSLKELYEDELIVLNYHINLPASDRFNLDNPDVPAARRVFYGLNANDLTVMNGRSIDFVNQFSAGLIDDTFSVSTLGAPFFDIEPTFTISNDRSKVDFVVTLKTTPDFKTSILDNITLYAAIVESKVDGIAGEPDIGVHYDIVKDFLPDAGGTLISGWNQHQKTKGPFEMSYEVSNIYNPESVNAVFFLQNNETKQIYQVRSMNLTNLNTITNIDAKAFNYPSMSVYPNPSSNILKLNAPIDSYFDIVNIHGDIMSSGRVISKIPIIIPLLDWPSGVYLVRRYKDGILQEKQKIIKQ